MGRAIVMEYLDGANLLDYLKRRPEGRISFDHALKILTPIMDALREVHTAGITHRDISPDNVYLCKSRQIKLLDFGAARLALRDQTQSGAGLALASLAMVAGDMMGWP